MLATTTPAPPVTTRSPAGTTGTPPAGAIAAGASGSSTAATGKGAHGTPAHSHPQVKTIVKTIRVYVHVPVRVTVKVPVMPKVPSGAHLPSRQPPLSFTRFVAPGANIGCSLSGAIARCDIASRVWAPPAKPKSCRLDWAQGLQVGGSGPGTFVCAGSTVLAARATVPDGRDDTVGQLTCQVRQFGVTCFDATNGHGFSISRTGYTTF